MWSLERGRRTVEKDIETTPQLGTYCPPSSLNWIHDTLRQFKFRGPNVAPPYDGFKARKALAPKVVSLSKIGRHERGPKGPDRKSLKEIEANRLKAEEENYPVPLDWKELRSLTKAREQREADEKEESEEKAYLKKVAEREALEEREVPISALERKKRREAAKQGFFSVWDGIGTARSASPSRRKVIEKLIMDKEKAKNDEIVDPTGRSPSMLLKAMDFETQEAAKVAHLNPSEIGLRLNDRAQGLRLWYEEGSNSSKAGPATAIPRYILGRKPPPSDLEICRPSTCFVRLPIPLEYRTAPRLTAEDQKKSLEKGGFGYKDKLLDYQVLADSCKRSHDTSRLLDEGRAVICMAVLYDNCQDYPKALENYARFLDICKRVEDKQGEALAYNCMGCTLQEAQSVKHALHDEEVATQTDDIIQYEQAMQYHIKHAEMADTEGKFVAFTNLGFVSMKLAKWNDAAQFFKANYPILSVDIVSQVSLIQKALKCCTTLEKPVEQSIALSNLGFLLFRRDKMLAAKACMSRYLQICRLLNDQTGQARAHFTLGNIAYRLERFLEARSEYTAALKYAQRTGNRQVETFSKVQLGIVEGTIKLATEAKLKAAENEQNSENSSENCNAAIAEEDIDVGRLSLNLGAAGSEAPRSPSPEDGQSSGESSSQ